MLSDLSIETIVAFCLRPCINGIQDKQCVFCGKDRIFLTALIAMPVEGDTADFTVKVAVRCAGCRSTENREWVYNPYVRPPVVEKPERGL